MIWLKARRAHTALPAGLLALFALVLLVQDSEMVLPSLLSGLQGTPILLTAPVVITTALIFCLNSRLPSAEISGTRRVAALDVALTATYLLVVTVGCMALGELLSSTEAVAVGRNSAFLVGLALCARPWAGEAATFVPVAWVVAVLVLGFRPTGDPYPWTVTPEPVGAPHAAVAAVLVLVAGLAALYSTSRKMP
ncbi:hypothetical protein [Streptomyces sp. BRB081]|uniref:hypothetical protein n=1 Tax=Streptomyces sp. BRB081 TaxID=2769544 RepID=UPI0018ACD839|nr:hypothetical protein [Streptomyces sp. BRB081]MBL3804428.1 hypothetical protein [Streptomyces sp. BRB081]